jgi:hypothetical protein
LGPTRRLVYDLVQTIQIKFIRTRYGNFKKAYVFVPCDATNGDYFPKDVDLLVLLAMLKKRTDFKAILIILIPRIFEFRYVQLSTDEMFHNYQYTVLRGCWFHTWLKTGDAVNVSSGQHCPACKQTRAHLYNSNTIHTIARTIVSVTSAHERLLLASSPPPITQANSSHYTPARYCDDYRVNVATLQFATKDHDSKVNERTFHSGSNTAFSIPSEGRRVLSKLQCFHRYKGPNG